LARGSLDQQYRVDQGLLFLVIGRAGDGKVGDTNVRVRLHMGDDARRRYHCARAVAFCEGISYQSGKLALDRAMGAARRSHGFRLAIDELPKLTWRRGPGKEFRN
jgi:hypothetical protein